MAGRELNRAGDRLSGNDEQGLGQIRPRRGQDWWYCMLIIDLLSGPDPHFQLAQTAMSTIPRLPIVVSAAYPGAKEQMSLFLEEASRSCKSLMGCSGSSTSPTALLYRDICIYRWEEG